MLLIERDKDQKFSFAADDGARAIGANDDDAAAAAPAALDSNQSRGRLRLDTTAIDPALTLLLESLALLSTQSVEQGFLLVVEKTLHHGANATAQKKAPGLEGLGPKNKEN